MTLPWGRHYLMCPPAHFGVLYEINPWMHREVAVEPERAHQQWTELASTLREAGAIVEVLDPVEGLPDLVFTANAGVVNGRQFVPARFRHSERQGEVPHDVAWFRAREYEIAELPEGVSHEGAGDTLPFGGALVGGYRSRSDIRAHTALSRITGAPVRAVELVEERLYHVDLTFCPLDDRRAIVAPDGWDRYGRAVIEQLVPEPLVLERDEALAFCANSVVVDRLVLMPSVPARVGRRLEAWDFEPVEVRVDEFLKAGGGCRCLTLTLDVTLSPPAARPEPA
jgi:N-dimethylarginine dimethylaminohydrolase